LIGIGDLLLTYSMGLPQRIIGKFGWADELAERFLGGMLERQNT
jgi:hypothetical protein